MSRKLNHHETAPAGDECEQAAIVDRGNRVPYIFCIRGRFLSHTEEGLMKQEAALSTVREIMLEFADATGLSAAGKPPRRYLWTDAFAVFNFLTLFQHTGDESYKQLALDLVAQVHGILGRHRGDDRRTGWISGLDDREGELHPTAGGLRIGKGMNERKPAEPFDERLEWDRDGQYYHYLTKWMHALCRVSRVTGEPAYMRWAIELAKTAHARFTYRPYAGARKRMYWKMSIDLSRPLVPSMGHHDPLDGLITCNELRADLRRESQRPAGLDLEAEIADMAAMCEGRDWATDDPLGLGELLSDAYRVGQLMGEGSFEAGALLEDLLSASLSGLDAFAGKNPFALPARYRLAFREFGLSIGLRAVGKLKAMMEEYPGPFGDPGRLDPAIAALTRYQPIVENIETFWLESTNRESGPWQEHRDINMVMLATSLSPNGFLSL